MASRGLATTGLACYCRGKAVSSAPFGRAAKAGKAPLQTPDTYMSRGFLRQVRERVCVFGQRRQQGEGMFQKLQTALSERPPSKEAILKQADGLRDLARRARRLTGTVTDEGDRRRLTRYSEELDESAARLEKAAVDARTG